MYFTFFLTTLLLLSLGVCEDDSTELFVHRTGELQFISTRLMQCKYSDNVGSNVLTWIFALLAPLTAIVYDLTVRQLLLNRYDLSNYLLMLGYLFLMTVDLMHRVCDRKKWILFSTLLRLNTQSS